MMSLGRAQAIVDCGLRNIALAELEIHTEARKVERDFVNAMEKTASTSLNRYALPKSIEIEVEVDPDAMHETVPKSAVYAVSIQRFNLIQELRICQKSPHSSPTSCNSRRSASGTQGR